MPSATPYVCQKKTNKKTKQFLLISSKFWNALREIMCKKCEFERFRTSFEVIYVWDSRVNTICQWELYLAGTPISVSCAYSGRVAIAYKMGGVKVKNDNPDNKFVNLCVSIYECESTGKIVFVFVFPLVALKTVPI